jgi:hypothetical protein
MTPQSDRELEATYRIEWRSRASGVEGHGRANLTYETARAWVRLMDEQYPEIEHWVGRTVAAVDRATFSESVSITVTPVEPE